MKSTVFLLAIAASISLSYAATDKVFCYFGSWAKYRLGDGKFDVEDIPPKLCTHGIYTFVGLSPEGTIKILDSWNEIDNKALTRFTSLRKINPNFKALLAIGGWKGESAVYSAVVNNPITRAILVKDIIKMVAEYGFDGFDLDWEYPAQRGGSPNDRVGFISLIKDLRSTFTQRGWLLTAAVYALKDYHSTSYDVPAMSQYLDYINVMTYDFYGAWSGQTGHNAPLYRSSAYPNNNYCVDGAIKGWIASGANPAKLILGLAIYGRTYTLADPNKIQMGAITTGAGVAGPFTQESGYLGYLEICQEFQRGGWTMNWDKEQQVPYASKGNQWIGYDDPNSIKLKTQYAKDMGLGGVMLWSIETEDAHNKCGLGSFPLLNAILSVLGSSSPPVIQTPPPPPPTSAPPTQQTTAGPAGSIPSSGQCTKEGYYRDPKDCSVFYSCVRSGNSYTASRFKCSNGLVFDTTVNVCNWPDQVKC